LFHIIETFSFVACLPSADVVVIVIAPLISTSVKLEQIIVDHLAVSNVFSCPTMALDSPAVDDANRFNGEKFSDSLE